MDQEAALAAQKEQCIFCKIIKGDIPSQKVYEDDKIIAILDIHPARKGHVLVMPKEHYPILPLLPFDEMQALFKKTKELLDKIKDGMLTTNANVFIANGAAAGQQSPHFLYHLIPREKNDMFTTLNVPTTGDAEANNKIVTGIKEKFGTMMQAYLSQVGRQDHIITKEATTQRVIEQSTAPKEEQLDKLIKIINENDDLKEAIINRPEEVKEATKTKDKWKELFAGVDIDKLSENLKVMAAANIKKRSQDDDDKGPDLDAISKVI